MALLETVAVAPRADAETGSVEAEAAALDARYGSLPAPALLELVLEELFPGRVALVSSFGAESAVLLHMLSEVDRNAPVIFLDSGRLFAETLEYRTLLVERLRLGDVRTVSPEPARVAAADPHRALWMTNPDACCFMRKTEPLQRALKGFDAWITGRKRFQNALRAELATFEADGGRIKVNPLAGWAAADLKAYAARHGLPEHPLVAQGYPSIGCVPCTSRVLPGEDQRAGRWRGMDKTECGIHVDLEIDGSGI
jgi:phosphoadenosine phosphosulfate reductase